MLLQVARTSPGLKYTNTHPDANPPSPVINDDVRIERESLSDVRESEAGSVTTAYTAKAPAVLLPDTEGAKVISQDVSIAPMSDDPSVWPQALAP